MTGATDLPDRARVVVIGGGIIGTSVAYHLGRLGVTDTVLIERHRLTAGTTWHAAGLMTCFGSLSETAMGIRQYSRELYARLEAETGLSSGFRPVGFIELAADAERLEEFRRVAAFNRHVGLEVEEIGPREVADLFPIADTSDVLAGFYVPGDGRVNPVDATMSLARGARLAGVTLVEGVSVRRVLTRNDRVVGVETTSGDVACDVVVNCAGMWGRELGERNGVVMPLQAAEHYYLITEPIDGVDPRWPVVEDPSRHGYYREEGGGLMVGLFEPVCAPWRIDGIPEDFAFGTLPADWDRMGPYVERAMSRVPATTTAGIRTFFCGPESFTPDLAPVVGESPTLDGYFVAAGMNSVGVLTGPGIGRVVAQWIVDGRPDVDVTAMHVDRMQAFQLNPRYRAERTVETLGLVYASHAPGRTMTTARGVRRSPLHDRMVAAGAYFREISGWEAPDWFAVAGPVGAEPTWGRAAWFDLWAQEHAAVRDGIGLFDMSFMAKFLVQGTDAGPVLDQLSANRVDATVGVITYTQWLNDAGGIEADVTVTKLADDVFLVIASDSAHGHVLARLRRRCRGRAATVTDVTSGYAHLAVQGPRSRELLQDLTQSPLDDASLPFRGVREIDLGFARVLCVRITYVGELGYELLIPADQAVHAYECILGAGEPRGLRHAGLRALGSLRLEKAYRDWGHDIDPTDHVLDAGLGFAVAVDKGDFVGRDAVLAARDSGTSRRRLVQVLVTDPEPLLHHGEVVLRDGVEVGYVRSGSYGHTLGGAVGLAMVEAGPDARDGVDADWIAAATWQVDIAGRRWPLTVSLRPMYDPTSARVRS